MSEIIKFHNDDAGYEDWLRHHHHDGFLLMKVGGQWKLHQADCRQAASASDASQGWTRNPKWVSTDSTALERMARAEGKRPPIRCEICES